MTIILTGFETPNPLKMRHGFGSRHAFLFDVEVCKTKLRDLNMKNLNIKAALVLSLLAFSACDKGGGKGNNNQVVGVPGVTVRQYSVIAGQNCVINANNTYTCTENGRSNGSVGFTSLETFCNVLSNEQVNGGVAYMTRQQMYREQCSNVNNNNLCGIGQVYQNGICINNGGTNIPTNPISNDPNVKNVQCQLSVKKGNTTGDTGLMTVPVIMNSKSGVNIFAYTNKFVQKKFLGVFNYQSNIYSNSEKLAEVKMYYTKESGKADMIKLEAKGVDKELNASVTGFAGSEIKLTIAPENEYSDATSLEITCQAQGATTGNELVYKAYRCKGEELEGKVLTKIDYASPYDDSIMNQSYDLSRSAKLHTEGMLSTDSGTATYEQTARYGIDSSVSTKTNITTPSAISVRRLNYRLNVECKPVQ